MRAQAERIRDAETRCNGLVIVAAKYGKMFTPVGNATFTNMLNGGGLSGDVQDRQFTFV
jgi:hypothetical protein